MIINSLSEVLLMMLEYPLPYPKHFYECFGHEAYGTKIFLENCYTLTLDSTSEVRYIPTWFSKPLNPKYNSSDTMERGNSTHCFLDLKGIEHQEFLPLGHKVNKWSYLEILQCLRPDFWRHNLYNGRTIGNPQTSTFTEHGLMWLLPIPKNSKIIKG